MATDQLRAVYRATLADVFGYLMGHTGGNRDLAEELTSETYLAAARHARHRGFDAITLPWLKTVARRRLIDHIRHQQSMTRRIERLGTELSVDGQFDPTSTEDTRARTLAALDRLSADHRLVLSLKYIDGMSVAVIADTIERSPKSVESLLTRARERFRAVYQEVGDGD